MAQGLLVVHGSSRQLTTAKCQFARLQDQFGAKRQDRHLLQFQTFIFKALYCFFDKDLRRLFSWKGDVLMRLKLRDCQATVREKGQSLCHHLAFTNPWNALSLSVHPGWLCSQGKIGCCKGDSTRLLVPACRKLHQHQQMPTSVIPHANTFQLWLRKHSLKVV